MSDRLQQLNIALKKALASAIIKVAPDSPVIVTDVLLDPSFKHGRVWLKGETPMIEQVKAKRVEIQNQLSRYIKLRYIPTLEFVHDDEYLEKMDNLFDKVSGG